MNKQADILVRDEGVAGSNPATPTTDRPETRPGMAESGLVRRPSPFYDIEFGAVVRWLKEHGLEMHVPIKGEVTVMPRQPKLSRLTGEAR